MALFNWLAKNKQKDLVKGESLALSKDDLIKQIESKGLTFIEAVQFKPSNFFKISVEEKAQFFYNLKSLIESGLLLPQSLELLLPNIKKQSFKNIVKDALFMLKNGLSFSQALIAYKETFDAFTIQLIKAGEESGRLNDAFKALNEYWELKNNFACKIKSALLGPIVILLFFVIIFIALLLYIIPAFKQLIDFKSLELNCFSEKIFNLSEFVTCKPYFFIFILIFIFFLIFLFLQSKFVKYVFFKIPIFYNIKRYMFLTTFLRALSMLLYSGISITKALSILEPEVVEVDLRIINSNLQKGISISKVLSTYKIFPNELIAMIDIAEESGKIAQAFEFASHIYFGYLDKMLLAFTYILQPMLIILLGTLIGLIIASIYLPIVQMPMGGMQ